MLAGSNYVEKMALISPATKDWPQTDEKISSMSNNMDNNSSRNSAMVMNQKLAHQDPQLQQQQQQQALKCPRCDSSNTKFCYYNNYSLTQPRHFCKACKRYWTRGGTLRNVPVGGGCRKNKRVKRPNINSSNNSSSSSIDAPCSTPLSTSSTTSTLNPLLLGHNHNPSSEHYVNNHPLFYGNNNPNSSEVNLLYQSRFGGNNSSRVVVSSLDNSVPGYDLIAGQQQQLCGLGLGFSSNIINNNNNIDVNANPSKEMHGIVNSSSNAFLSSYSSLIGPGDMFSAPSTCTTTPTTMSSLIASYGLQNHKFSSSDKQQGTRSVGAGANQFQTFFPFEEMQISSSHGFGSSENKDVKVEEEVQNRLGWKNGVIPCQNQMEQISSSSDPTSYWNNNNNAAHAGAWPDLANIGSSVTSLI